jgi:hypothetical protein
MKNLTLTFLMLISTQVFCQSQRFEYDLINLNTNGEWLPKDIGMKSILILEKETIKNYVGDNRFEYTIVQRFSRDELELDETLTLIFAALVLDEENQEVIILITDQFTSITDVAKKMTFRYSNN